MMVKRWSAPILLAAGAFYGAACAWPVHAQQKQDLAPYNMLRSLQFVQDSVVLGDHSAGEMQRFMLGTLDDRLRSAPAAVFEDPRNVDAALIYAMSGGNPTTLEYLASRDIAGNFDNRVTDALRKYLSGKGTLIAKSLADMAEEYKDRKLGPYLALVTGNVTVPRDPKAALAYYDWARLTAPGTIIEEAALRRSVAITVDGGMVDKALNYSRQYARRFEHSPYASQFVDFFVQLVVGHYGEVKEEDIDNSVEFFDVDRRREVFLRIARAATIGGKTELARLASAKAEALGGDATRQPETLARLYGGVATVPTNNTSDAMQALSAIPDEILSPRDRALREAAKVIAEQVVTKPTAESLAQEKLANITNANDANLPVAQQPGHDVGGSKPAAEGLSAATAAPVDTTFQTFVDNGRSKLTAIDALLNEEKASK